MTNGNDEAFGHGSSNGHCPGLTKREYFAAMAASGMCVNMPEMGKSHAQLIAQQSVEIADALIEALNKDARTS